jgi:hypothetical protein
MAQLHVSAAALISARPEQAYAVIADYHDGHPRILPRPPFVSLQVEEGGIGAGTVIRAQMRVLGRVQTFRAAIAEPEPGRVLTETDLDTGMVTTFTVDPRRDGRNAHVTITTDMEIRDGILGTLQGWFTTRFLRPAYEEELVLLAGVAAERDV